MIDVVRGVLRVRKWPRKRGKPKSEAQRFWISWFQQANLLAKYADGYSQARAIELTRKTGMYPRDIILKAIRGRLYTWVDETGWRWFPMAARLDISESLDVLAQTVGSLLVRAGTYWQDVGPGVLGNVLTHRGPGAPPEWIAPAGGGGITQEVLAGTPIVPDGTVNKYDVDISAYLNLSIILDGIGFAASTRPVLRFSTDGGTTFKAGAADYKLGWVSASSDSWTPSPAILLDGSTAAASHNAVINLTNILAGRCSWQTGGSQFTSAMLMTTGFFGFASPVTDLRIMSESGSNFTAGTIHLVGEK